MNDIKWKSILGLIILLLAVYFSWNWLWGLFFLYWVVGDVIRGETYFFDHISRWDDPVLYWCLMVSWTGLSLLYFFG